VLLQGASKQQAEVDDLLVRYTYVLSVSTGTNCLELDLFHLAFSFKTSHRVMIRIGMGDLNRDLLYSL